MEKATNICDQSSNDAKEKTEGLLKKKRRLFNETIPSKLFIKIYSGEGRKNIFKMKRKQWKL